MNRRRLGALAIGLGAVLLAWLAPVRTHAGPPAVGIIQLTSDNAVDVRPAWSPDNRSIAFQSSRDGNSFHIYVMDADGSHQRALTQGSADDRHPAWMPDGRAILYDSSNGTQSEIWMVNVADGSRRQITHLGKQVNFPAPSRDGQHISFYLFDGAALDLWTARIDGGESKPLIRQIASADNGQCTFACHQAGWSLDGRTIAYSAGEQDSIYTIPSEGGTPKVLVANGEDNHFPWFTADGQLGYVTEHINPAQSWTDAWLYDLKSGKAVPLQQKMSPQGPFEWSTDNKKVLFHSPRSGNFEIYLVDLSVPEGVEALQGTPVPVQRAADNAMRPAPAASSAANNTAGGPNLLVYGAGLVVAAGLAIMGFLGWRKSRRA